MRHWKVECEAGVASEIVSDLKAGRLTEDDIKVLKRWVKEVESKGLAFAQASKSWRDHELVRGKWKGYRAISFSFSGRLIYRVEGGRLIVMVVRVTPNHDYE